MGEPAFRGISRLLVAPGALLVWAAFAGPLPAQEAGRKEADEIVRRTLEGFRLAVREARTLQERALAVQALGDCDVKDPSMAVELVRFFNATSSDINYVLPVTAASSLARFRGDRVAAQILLQAAAQYRKVPYVQKKVVQALGKVGHEAALPLLQELLRSGDAGQAALAIEAWSRMPGAIALEPLLKEWEWLDRKKQSAGENWIELHERVQPLLLEVVRGMTDTRYLTLAEYQLWWTRRGAGFKQAQKAKDAGAEPPVGTRLPAVLLVEILFNAGAGTSAANTGSSSGWFRAAALTGPQASWSRVAPPNGGPFSLEWGTGPSSHAVDLGGAVEHLRNLASFTITGWLNCRSGTEAPGGNRIVTWLAPGRDGVELVYRADGSLQLGVNQPAEASAARSEPRQVPTFAEGGDDSLSENWRFFAVTYDSTLPGRQVRFYFGSALEDAELRGACDGERGPVGGRTGPGLSVGNVNAAARPAGAERNFRGLLDEIRIFGSTSDGSGALPLDRIIALQNREVSF